MILFGNLVPAMADGIHTFTHSFIPSSIKNVLGVYCVPGGLFGLAVTQCISHTTFLPLRNLSLLSRRETHKVPAL